MSECKNWIADCDSVWAFLVLLIVPLLVLSFAYPVDGWWIGEVGYRL